MLGRAIVVALSTLCLLPCLNYYIKKFDEGVALTAAWRILNGEWPYRDFLAFYPPAQFAWLAGLFSVFGASITVERLFHILCQVIIITQLIRWTGNYLIAPFAVMVFAWVPAFGYAALPALALTLTRFTVASAAVAGLLAGLTMIWKLEIGVWSAAATFAAWLIVFPGRRYIVRWILAAAVAPVVTLAALLSAMPLATVRAYLLEIPGNVAIHHRLLPIPSAFTREGLAFYIPLLLASGTLFVGLWLVRTNRETASKAVTASVFALALIAQAWVHIDPTHMIGPLLLAAAAVAVLTNRLRLATNVPLVVVLLLMAGAIVLKVRPIGTEPIASDMRATAADVMARTRPDEPIYIGTYRHDVIFVNDISLYFLARRRPGTFYHELVPGIATSEGGQRRIIEDLKDNRVRVVVLWQYGPDVWEPIPLVQRPGSQLLDTYLNTNYTRVARHGEYEILERRLTPFVIE